MFSVTSVNTENAGHASYLQFPSVLVTDGGMGCPLPCFPLAWDQT